MEEELKCPICFNLAESPYESSCCGNIFCNNCVSLIFKNNSELSPKCPICRKPANFRESSFAKRLLTNLLVTCNYKCGIKKLYFQMKEHLKVCPEKEFSCKLDKICKFFGKKEEYLSHIITLHGSLILKISENLDKIREILPNFEEDTTEINEKIEKTSINGVNLTPPRLRNNNFFIRSPVENSNLNTHLNARRNMENQISSSENRLSSILQIKPNFRIQDNSTFDEYEYNRRSSFYKKFLDIKNRLRKSESSVKISEDEDDYSLEENDKTIEMYDPYHFEKNEIRRVQMERNEDYYKSTSVHKSNDDKNELFENKYTSIQDDYNELYDHLIKQDRNKLAKTSILDKIKNEGKDFRSFKFEESKQEEEVEIPIENTEISKEKIEESKNSSGENVLKDTTDKSKYVEI